MNRGDNKEVTLYDVGGGEGIRGMWEHYYAECHGAVYVVDSADKERMEQAKEALRDATANEHLRGKPLLILANKQDIATALSEQEVEEALEVPALAHVDSHRVISCIALPSSSSELDTRRERHCHYYRRGNKER